MIVSWSALEPTCGAYDTAYVARIRQAVDWAASYGLYVVPDMHQDAWGIAVDTLQDVTCPAGTFPNNGWDGAPAWATITDGASTCRPGERETAPAVRHAWQHFYDDTDGIQTELVRTWGRLARDFADDSTAAGYDLLNEPGFGTAADNDADLGAFYGRAIRAIRAGERAGAVSHIVFFEPNVLWSASAPGPRRSGSRRTATSSSPPHLRRVALAEHHQGWGSESARTTAASYGVTVGRASGGSGLTSRSTPPTRSSGVRRRRGPLRVRRAWWDWKQACGDPHMTGHPGGEPAPVSPSLVRYTCPDQAAQPVDPAFGDVLSRPVPRGAGPTTTLTSDGRTGAFELAGRHTAGAKRCAPGCGSPVGSPTSGSAPPASPTCAVPTTRQRGAARLRRGHLSGCAWAEPRLCP